MSSVRTANEVIADALDALHSDIHTLDTHYPDGDHRLLHFLINRNRTDLNEEPIQWEQEEPHYYERL